MPLALVRPKPQPVSDPERPEFAWETFADIARELPPLFKEHWQEIALNQKAVPLDPHWDRYFDLALAGILRVLTVRVRGVLVGYHFVFVFPHLHYFSTMWAESDMCWLAPPFRTGWTGYRLLKIVCEALRDNGVKVHTINEKLAHPFLQPLLKRLGYTAIETKYAKVF